MPISNNILNYVIVLLITFALAYTMGTSILLLIDRKMSDISINVPKPRITLRIPNQTIIQQEGGAYKNHMDPEVQDSNYTYYKAPSEMTPKQQEKFKYESQFSKMTIHDYLNWLSLFKEDIDILINKFPQHYENFKKYHTNSRSNRTQ